MFNWKNQMPQQMFNPSGQLWDAWKKGFYAWEQSTADLIEQWMRSPLVLGPSGALLASLLKAKVKSDDARTKMWGGLGLPTKRDQERTLHLLNQLQSRLLDLEEQLQEIKEK